MHVMRVHCTLYCLHVIINDTNEHYIIRVVFHTVKCTLLGVKCFIVHCTMYTAHCTLYTVHCTQPLETPVYVVNVYVDACIQYCTIRNAI